MRLRKFIELPDECMCDTIALSAFRVHRAICVQEKAMINFSFTAAVIAVAMSISSSASAALTDDTPNAEAVAAREAAFTAAMRKTVLVGSFTVDGKASDEPLKPERYEIESVTKASGNLWIFTARIKYGKLDTKLPITVPVEWAGDTPMVSLTNASIPGLGEEFSARVIFHDDRYAGTWQHGKVGGHMFGRIEKQAVADPPNDSP